MPAEVKILVKGYTNAIEIGEVGQEQDCPTITLVRDGELVMVVDPGVLKSQQILVDALAEENLIVDDVNVVCITHSHIDHYRNIGMFPNAKALEYSGIWDKDTVEPWQEYISSNVQIVRTPGHVDHGITLFVTTEIGVVAICGDIFWRENYPEDPANDPFAFDSRELKESRRMVIKMADWIIPGHGDIFKSNKSKLSELEKTVEITKKKDSNGATFCKKCHRLMIKKDRCLCRTYLCFRCCECEIDCNMCSCSHKKARR